MSFSNGWDEYGGLYLYHYTSHEGLAGILRDGVIHPSSRHGHPTGWVGGVNVTGGAVFLTRKGPQAFSREAVAFSNYG
jgi:hypothetical protein